MSFILRDYQNNAVKAVLNDIDKEGNSLVVLPTGCHEKDYLITMSDGSLKAVQNIKVGDFVMGLNSIPRKVIELHRGNEKGYEITTTKGESFRVNENHILHLRNTTTPDKYYPAYVNISVKDYLLWAKSRKHLYKLIKRGYEPFFNSDYKNSQGEIPYMVGIWLGDGSANTSQITNPDIEIVDYMKEFCAENNLNYRKLSGKYLHSITSKTEIPRRKKAFNIFRNTLAKYNLYGNKHIPEIYFLSERNVRLNLLAGIIDADGYYDQVKNIYELGLSNERLFDDCIRLIHSLGFGCSKRLKIDCNGKTVFRTTISGEGQETIPCLVKRKQARPRQQIKDVRSFGFKIEPIGEMDYYGFSIDGNDKLYIDGQGFVQHNSGKSLVIADVAQKLNKPILILQPSREILQQNYNKLTNYVSKREIGIYSASFGRKDIRKFTFATIQSIYKKPELFEHIGLVLIDECQGVNIKNTASMFTSFLKGIGQNKVIGFTATPYRNMQTYYKNKYGGFVSSLTLKLINRVKPDFWKRIIFNINNQELFEQGYLCPIKYFDRSAFDHKDIKMNKSHSDFDVGKFSKQLEMQRPAILDLINRASKKMHSILVFCNSVAEAESYARQVPNSASVNGKTPKKERDGIIDSFRDGTIKVVFNVSCLGIGFDHPKLDCIFVLRPTRSLGLWYQLLGRGIRIAEGKEYCVVVDFTSNLKHLGRIETIKLVKEKGMFDYSPMWQLKSETGSWHNRELYSFTKQK